MTQAQETLTQPDFDSVETALRRLGSEAEAAECQGHLCGMLCSKGEWPGTEWLVQNFPSPVAGDVLGREARGVLLTLYEATWQTMNNSVLDFELLLPDDDVAMTLRAQALGEWCQGFLAGLAEGGVRDYEALPGESAELVQDLAKIAQAGSFEIHGDEEDEAAYAELVEYVRVGVLLIQEELQPRRSLPDQDVTLH